MTDREFLEKTETELRRLPTPQMKGKPMLLLDYIRSLDLPCRALYQGRHMTWTVDEAKSAKASAAGATIQTVTATSGRVVGFEISFPVGHQVEGEIAA